MENQKTIIITGACGIIGSGILKGLISEQYNLILVDNNKEKIEELSKKINSKKILFIEANILKKHEIDLCIEKGLDKFEEAKRTKPRKWLLNDWPDLTKMDVFK